MNAQRTIAAALLAAICLVAASWTRGAEADKGFAINVPGVPKVKILNPDVMVRAFAAFVATNDDWRDAKGKLVKGHNSWRPEDVCNIRAIAIWDTQSAEDAATLRRLISWWSTQMSFNPHVEPLRSVPGTNDRLVWIDLRDYRWNAASWQAVAEREAYICEPWIDHENAEYLRRRLIAPLSKKAIKGREVAIGGGKTEKKLILPAGTIVSGSQWLREVIESDRSDSYYDLLFSDYRYTDVAVTGGAGELSTTRKSAKKVTSVPLVPPLPKLYVDDGKGYSRELTPGEEFPPGVKVYEWRDEKFVPWAVPPAKVETVDEDVPVRLRTLPQGTITSKFVNFPKNEEDWEKAFGIDKVKGFMREKKIDLDFGAVVEGGKDDPKGGSLVALQNRLLVTVVGPYGAAMETYDVNETAGVKDFTESLIFQGKHFQPGEGAQAVRDAGELLAYLPNGGQAGLLVDGKGNRQEIAGNNIAEDSGSTTKDKRVRNVGSCVVCHAPDGGYIIPKDVIADGKNKGLRIKFKDREQENRVHSFFKDQTSRVKSFTLPYLSLLEETTRPLQADPKAKPLPGWTGVQLAKEFEKFRRERDNSLTLEQAAAEVGVPVARMKQLLDQIPLLRMQMLMRGKPIPRRTWEKDGFPNCALLLAAERDEAAAKEYKKR